MRIVITDTDVREAVIEWLHNRGYHDIEVDDLLDEDYHLNDGTGRACYSCECPKKVPSVPQKAPDYT